MFFSCLLAFITFFNCQLAMRFFFLELITFFLLSFGYVQKSFNHNLFLSFYVIFFFLRIRKFYSCLLAFFGSFTTVCWLCFKSRQETAWFFRFVQKWSRLTTACYTDSIQEIDYFSESKLKKSFSLVFRFQRVKSCRRAIHMTWHFFLLFVFFFSGKSKNSSWSNVIFFCSVQFLCEKESKLTIEQQKSHDNEIDFKFRKRDFNF